MFKTLKTELNLVEVIGDLLGCEMKLVSTDTYAPEDEVCPSCGHSKCFRVKHDGDNFSSFAKCFGEDKYWDVISFNSLISGTSQYVSAKDLAKRYKVSLPTTFSPLQELFNLAAEYYHTCLLETCSQSELGGRTPVEYQTEIRGHNSGTLSEFKIGWSDGGLVEYLESFGIDKQVIQESGLASRKGGDLFPAKLFIYPHFVGGNVSRFTQKDPLGRVQFQLAKKYYLNNSTFYGQQTLSRVGPVIVVEGENDWLSVLEGGHEGPVLCANGSISREQLDWVSTNLKDRDVVTIFDPDPAGDVYREKFDKLKNRFSSLRQVKLRAELGDIDKYLKQGGGELTAVLGGAEGLSAVDFFTDQDSEEEENEGLLNIQEKDGCYYKIKMNKDGEPSLVKISNFTMRLHNIYIHGQEREREIIVRRYDGKTSNPIKVTSDAKVSLKPFKTLVANAIDASFYGAEADLTTVWEHVYTTSTERVVYLTDYVGRLEEFHGWLFRDCFISDTGGKYLPDESGSIWLGYRDIGIKPVSIVSSDAGADTGIGIPRIGNRLPDEEVDGFLKSFIETLGRNLGNLGSALLCVAWMWSCTYSNVIFRKNRSFPFLLIWGKTRGGKTTITGWLRSLYDMSEQGAVTVKTYGSGVSFARRLAYYGSLPMCIDELRGDQESVNIYSAFRSWYDRVPKTVGDLKNSSKVVEAPVRATLMLSGEDHLSDPAARNRCIPVRLVSDESREMRETYNWIEARKDWLPSIGYKWICDSGQVDKAELVRQLSEKEGYLRDKGINPRTAIIWSIVYIFGMKLCDAYFPDFDYEAFILQEAMSDVESQEEDDTLTKFWEIVEGMQAEERAKITGDHIRREGGELYVWYADIQRIVEKEAPYSAREKFSSRAVREMIREQPYFVKEDRRTMGVGEKQRRVMILDLTCVPEVLQRIADYLG